MRKETVSAVAMACSIVISQSLALFLAPFFFAMGAQAFPDPNSPTNPIIYLILIIAFTALILLIVRKRRENLLRYIVLGSMFLSMIFVFFVPAWFVLFPFADELRSNLAFALSLVVSALLTYALFKNPEWYVVDAVGILVAAGVTSIMGISFTILPTLILLILLALYDAISVYKTKHMVTLADAVAGEKLPIIFVVPKKLDYSYKEQGSIKKQIASGEEREAMFMGLGDMIIPGVLVVSAMASNADKLSTLVLGIPGPLVVAIGTLIGGLLGFSILMRFVVKGNPQAGLPLLNSGVILGYLITYYLVFNDVSFGIKLG